MSLKGPGMVLWPVGSRVRLITCPRLAGTVSASTQLDGRRTDATVRLDDGGQAWGLGAAFERAADGPRETDSSAAAVAPAPDYTL